MEDYATAYAAMKEQLEVRLRHEARRGDFYEARAAALAADLTQRNAELEAAGRWGGGGGGRGRKSRRGAPLDSRPMPANP